MKHPELKESKSIGKVWEAMNSNPAAFDPRAFFESVMDTVMYGIVANQDRKSLVNVIEAGVKEALAPLIIQFGSYGKSSLVKPLSLEDMAGYYRKKDI